MLQANGIKLLENSQTHKFTTGVPGKEGGAAVFGCTEEMSGRYVSVQIRGHSQILTVCEIQVFQGRDTAIHDSRAEEAGLSAASFSGADPLKGRKGSCLRPRAPGGPAGPLGAMIKS